MLSAMIECNGLVWEQLHASANQIHLGYIPTFLSAGSDLSASEQITANYPFGGWMPFKGFSMDKATGGLKYTGDPIIPPMWQTKLPATNEVVTVYPYAWVQIMQPDGTWEVARLD